MEGGSIPASADSTGGDVPNIATVTMALAGNQQSQPELTVGTTAPSFEENYKDVGHFFTDMNELSATDHPHSHGKSASISDGLTLRAQAGEDRSYELQAPIYVRENVIDSGKNVDVLEELLESLGASSSDKDHQSNLEVEERPVGEENLIVEQQSANSVHQISEGSSSTRQPLYGLDVGDGINQSSFQTIRISCGNIDQQLPVFLTQGASGNLEPVMTQSMFNVSVPGQQPQQIVIPIDMSEPQQLQTGNTVLLPIIPTLMPDGKIEIRVAGNAIPLNATNLQQSGALQATPINIRCETSALPQEFLQAKINVQDNSELGAKVIVIGDEMASSEYPEESEGKLSISESSDLVQKPTAVKKLSKGKRQKTGTKGPPEPRKIFTCELCDYTNIRRYLLQRHLKSHSEHRPYSCSVCDRNFKTLSSLNNHTNTHTGTKPFKCKECEMAFTTSGELVRHIRYKHTLEKPHKCQECDYATVELSKLKRHMRSHTGERPFKCEYCEYSSPDTYKLKRHIRVHTGEKPYECEVCQARFTQSNSLKTHRHTHTPDEKPSFQCEYCPTTCGRKTDLRIHVQKLHESPHPIRCMKCGKSFPDRYSFKVHYRSHDGQKCFSCPHCAYSAFSQRHLEQHIMVHSDTKPYLCASEGCGKTFRQLSQLKRHENLSHNPHYVRRSALLKYRCKLCDKPFKHMGNLKRHERMHADGEYDFPEFDEEEDEPLSPELPLLVVEKADIPDEESAVLESIRSEAESLKVNLRQTTAASSPKMRRELAKRKKVLLKKMKKRLNPEQMGLTNFKRRGRPKKLVRSPKLGGTVSLDRNTRSEKPSGNFTTTKVPVFDHQREIDQSFGFANSETTEQDKFTTVHCTKHDDSESAVPGSQMSTADALSITDSAGFPIPGATGLVDNQPLDPDASNQPSMFDIVPDDLSK